MLLSLSLSLSPSVLAAVDSNIYRLCRLNLSLPFVAPSTAREGRGREREEKAKGERSRKVVKERKSKDKVKDGGGQKTEVNEKKRWREINKGRKKRIN